MSSLKTQQTFDAATVLEHSGASATYRHSPTRDPKPCLHPLTTPAGHRLTGFEMSDHVWHRGLWFTIKFVNGTNFWEEHDPFGRQTGVEQPRLELVASNEARLTHRIDWRADVTGLVFREYRTLRFHFGDDGVQTIDWTSELEPMTDLLLDRTPYTTWGGYSGLTYRATREFHGANFLTPGGETVPQLIGVKHDWAVIQGNVDGGLAQKVSVGIIDHPANPRGQTPWYGKSADGYAFFNAAFLFQEPMNVRRGEVLTFRYRVHYRDGLWTADEFAKLAAAFREGGVA